MSRRKAKRTTPRDWVRGRAFPWPAPAALGPGDSLVACYAVRVIEAVRVNGDDVVRLTLGEARGSLEAWAPAAVLPPDTDWLRTGAYVGVRAAVHPTDTGVAAEIEAIAPVHVDLGDLPLFLPSSARDAADMENELAAWMASVEDPGFAALLAQLLGPDSESGPGFRLAPAATRHHHAWLGGLLEHTLSVTSLCEAMAGQFSDEIDRDLLITGALLHDIGKVREIGAQEGFPYTEEGNLLGHILLGLQMLDEAARVVPGLEPGQLLRLRHMVASHQGRYEWQSPREPRTPEALLLHHADDLDAKLDRFRSRSGASARRARPAGPRSRVTGNPRAPASAPHARDDDTLDMFT